VRFPGRAGKFAATKQGKNNMTDKTKFQNLAQAQKYYMQQGMTISEAMEKIRAEHIELRQFVIY